MAIRIRHDAGKILVESGVTQTEAQHHDNDDERNPQARGKNLADADEIFPEQRRGGRAGGRQLEPRAPGLLIFLRALPVAGAHGGDARGQFLRRFHRRFLERHVRINDPQVVEQKNQQHRRQRDEKRHGIRREERPHDQPEGIKQIQRRAGGQNALRIIQRRTEIGDVGGIQLPAWSVLPKSKRRRPSRRPAPKTNSRRSQLEMPRSSNIVRANEEPRK